MSFVCKKAVLNRGRTFCLTEIPLNYRIRSSDISATRAMKGPTTTAIRTTAAFPDLHRVNPAKLVFEGRILHSLRDPNQSFR